MASPRRCRRPRAAAISSSSTPPARWSPRSTSRPTATTREGLEIVLIGHAGHPEVVGTMGQLPAGADPPDRDRGATRAPSRRGIRTSSPSSPRPRCRSTTPPRSSASLQGALPRHRRAAEGGHLLRHDQPPGRGEGDCAADATADRGRRAQNLQFAAPGRGGGARRLRQRAPDRARGRHPLGPGSTASPPSASPPAPPRRRSSSRR